MRASTTRCSRSSSTRSRRSSPPPPAAPGTKQGLIVFLFHGEAISQSLLLAFSVGMNIAVVVFNVVLGAIALFLMARTLSWKRLRAAKAAEEPT